MTPGAFADRWLPLLPIAERATFLDELAVLVGLEHSRERRRLTTDAVALREACEDTARELRVHGTPA